MRNFSRALLILLQIRDISGRIARIYKLPARERSVTLDFTLLIPGMYLLEWIYSVSCVVASSVLSG